MEQMKFSPLWRCNGSSAILCRGKGILLCVLLLAFFIHASWLATALKFESIIVATQQQTPGDLLASVQAVVALRKAIEAKEVEEKVSKALEFSKKGFLPCKHNVYQCNNGVIVKAVIEGLESGRVNWASFPSTVTSIHVRDSVLKQFLVLAEFPRELEEFTAVNTRWESSSLSILSPSTMLTDSSKYLRCAKKNAKECFYNLKAMSCVNCRLTTTNFTSSSVLFPKLSALNLSSNPFTSFDFRETPGSVSTLQISHVQLKESSVTEVLSLLPKSIKKLNISYSGLDFEWSMLKNGWPNMDMLDLSGLVPRAAISERRLGEGAVAAQKPLSSICDHAAGKSIKELHVSNCSLAGELPDFTNCEHLEVLDMSQNLFSTLRLDKFPPGLRGLNLRGNNFSNVLNVSQLPQRLLSLDLSKNRLHGTISTASLPPQISYFDISHNAFSGTLNLTELPETARFVYLQYNNFTGEAELSDIPLGIRFIMIHHNNWDCRMPAP